MPSVTKIMKAMKKAGNITIGSPRSRVVISPPGGSVKQPDNAN